MLALSIVPTLQIFNTTTGATSLYGDFFGLDDLWTERKEVKECIPVIDSIVE